MALAVRFSQRSIRSARAPNSLFLFTRRNAWWDARHGWHAWRRAPGGAGGRGPEDRGDRLTACDGRRPPSRVPALSRDDVKNELFSNDDRVEGAWRRPLPTMARSIYQFPGMLSSGVGIWSASSRRGSGVRHRQAWRTSEKPQAPLIVRNVVPVDHDHPGVRPGHQDEQVGQRRLQRRALQVEVCLDGAGAKQAHRRQYER